MQTPKQGAPIGHMAMLGANIMWGLMAPIAKLTMASAVVLPLLMTDFRIFGAAMLFWIASAFAPKEHVPLPDLLRLAGAAMLGILFNQGSFIFGVSLTSPGEASVITTTMPLWVMLLAALILKEPITLKKAGGIALGATGALILVFSGSAIKTASAGSNPTLGDLLVLGAQLSYALYLTLYKNFIKRYTLITLMKWMFTFAAIVLLPLSLPTIIATPWSSLTAEEMWGVTYVVVCGTFLAYICIMTGQKLLRPTIVGMYNYAQPVVAMLIGIWLGLDSFTLIKALAIGCIFSGVYLVTTSRARTN